MMAVWPSRFPTVASAAPYAHNPRALANKVYNGRMGNREGSDDGWNFRGRGAVQTTGREGYERLARATGLDAVARPDVVNDPAHFLACGVADFIGCGCLPYARRDDTRGVTTGKRTVLITAHRRESWGEPMARTARAIARLARRFEDTTFLLPAHLNPAVREVLLPPLAGIANVTITAPLDYREFVRAMRDCTPA